jgi:hypothetical protein
VRTGDHKNLETSLGGGKAKMRHEFSPGLAYSPESLSSLQQVFDRAWQSYVSAGLAREPWSNSNELRENIARSIFKADAEGLPLMEIEGRMMHGLCDRLYAAVLAL